MNKKQFETLTSDPSVLREVLGDYDGPYALGISRYPAEDAIGQFTLYVDHIRGRAFPKFIKRYGRVIEIKVFPGFKAPQAYCAG